MGKRSAEEIHVVEREGKGGRERGEMKCRGLSMYNGIHTDRRTISMLVDVLDPPDASALCYFLFAPSL